LRHGLQCGQNSAFGTRGVCVSVIWLSVMAYSLECAL
jgi:hypothetical protein